MSSKAGSLISFEWLRLCRSPMRVMAIVVFLLCGVGAVASGIQHLNGWKQTHADLREREQSMRDDALGWLRTGLKGPEDRSYIDVTSPRWADRYASAHMSVAPDPLAALAIGLSDVRGTWAPVAATSGAKPFETHDPATLGNAEKLLSGNFDLVFVLTYLLPLLLLILLFDVGGLERDLGMLRLVRIQVGTRRGWLFKRILAPVLIVVGLVIVLCVVGGFWTGAIGSATERWALFLGLAIGYTFLWAALFGAVLASGAGTSSSALWMAGLWIGFCVVVPAAVRQVVAEEHPSLYATERTDAMRSKRYDILLSDVKEYQEAFYEARPDLSRSPKSRSRRAASTRSLFIKQAAFLDMVSGVTEDVSKDEIAREAAIARYGWVNPAYVFQRALCVLAGTESVSFRKHRQNLLDGVSIRLESLIEVTWLGEAIDDARFESLLDHGAEVSYGESPEKETSIHLIGLFVVAAIAAFILARLRKDRELRTGIV